MTSRTENNSLWNRLSLFKISDSVHPLERKRLIVYNQTFILTFATMIFLFLCFGIAYTWMLFIDFDRYLENIWAFPPLALVTLADIAFYYFTSREKLSMISVWIHGILLISLIVLVCIYFGGIFSFEYAAVPIGTTAMLLMWHRPRVMFFTLLFVSSSLFLLRFWTFQHLPVYELPFRVKEVFYNLTGIALPAVIFSMAYFVLRESHKAETAFIRERDRSDSLLENILPHDVANELKDKGAALPREFESATVMFTDFVGFTKIAEKMKPSELIEELDYCFSYFDSVMTRFGIERLKTIGDSYMAVAGVPSPSETHARDMVLAAVEIAAFIEGLKAERVRRNLPFFEIRIGISTGPLVAGIVGKKKFAYDVWGDTVNIASRMESSGESGKINISRSTYNIIKKEFKCRARGKIQAKNKGRLDMYFVEGLKNKSRNS